MCCFDPNHLNWPATIIPIVVDRASASSIECVVNITAEFLPLVEIFDMMSHMNLLAFGSIPAEGSSRKTTGGLPIMAIATDSFLLLPPDSVPASLCSYCSRFMLLSWSLMRSSTNCRGIFLILL
mmetsp:Transcript_42652/g.49915  ORF Transcript_42652/g.49915 Transcript_42652/m.49915 type:complete len:124 (-) Transcript_42652:681-1052(-)